MVQTAQEVQEALASVIEVVELIESQRERTLRYKLILPQLALEVGLGEVTTEVLTHEQRILLLLLIGKIRSPVLKESIQGRSMTTIGEIRLVRKKRMN